MSYFLHDFFLGIGSCIIKYVDERFTLYIVGWRGTSSLRAYVDSNETLHILRLLGADLSKFGKFFHIKEVNGLLIDFFLKRLTSIKKLEKLQLL